MQPETEPENTVPLDDIAGFVEQYTKTDAKIRELVALKDALRKQIERTVGDAEVGTIAGAPVIRYRHTLTRRLSMRLVQKRFSEEELADCWTETAGRAFYLLVKP